MTQIERAKTAFDAAVKRAKSFDYRGRAVLEGHGNYDTLVAIQQIFNAGLAQEGQNTTTHAPHPPFYFDYLDSDVSNALAFCDGAHSFIGVTIPLVHDVHRAAAALSASDTTLATLALPATTERKPVFDALFWMMLNFVVTHEYSHHVHGHVRGAFEPVEEIRGHALSGSVARQALEADADGYSAYMSLGFWFDNPGGRALAIQLTQTGYLPIDAQDEVIFSLFFVAVAGFTFLREPEPLEEDKVYYRTHPPQPLRLSMVTVFMRKWASEFRPALHGWMTEKRYQSLLDAVSSVLWIGRHVEQWSAQASFLRSPDGIEYVETVYAALNGFRATLGQFGANAMP